MSKIILFIVCASLIFFVITRIAIRIEKISFNNGKCLICGTKLRHFDTDSHGGRGYICDRCHYNTRVSYHSVDKEFLTKGSCKTCLYNKSASSRPVCLECDGYNSMYECDGRDV